MLGVSSSITYESNIFNKYYVNMYKYIVIVLTSLFVIACRDVTPAVKEFVIEEFNYCNWENLLQVENAIQLEENDSCLMSYAEKCMITKDNIIFMDYKTKNIYSFSRNGKFTGHIGHVGRAQTEYLGIRDICINCDSSAIIVLDERGLISYELKSGKFLERNQFASPNYIEYEKIMQVNKSEYLCFTDTRDKNSIVLDSPKEIKGLRESKRFHYVLNPFYKYQGASRVISDYGDFYIDSFEGGKLQTLYKINLGNDALPDNILPKTYKEFEIVDSSPRYFKCIASAYETTNWICLDLIGPNNEYYIAFLDKGGNKYAFGVNNQNLGLTMTGTDDESFYAIIYPEFISQESVAKKILERYKINQESVSPVLIKFKLNEKEL